MKGYETEKQADRRENITNALFCPGGEKMHNIGRILKEGRVARGLEIGDIARKTCICARYVKAMEEGRFQIIPNVFDKGYLKIYASLLDMDAKPLLALYEQKKSAAAEQQAAGIRSV
jgi:cytoskeletal protein RodZ